MQSDRVMSAANERDDNVDDRLDDNVNDTADDNLIDDVDVNDDIDGNIAEIEDFLDELETTEGLVGDDETPVVETELDVVTRERNEFKDMALRLQADFENYRKRMANQHSEDVERAAGKLVQSLLPVLDACEAAFAHGADGVEPIWSQLMGVLQKHGLEALDLADKPFDPAVAEAVLHEPGDGHDPVVTEVLRTGYRWKGKILRAAMVKVKG
jgi:molecular chaperone GrpE